MIQKESATNEQYVLRIYTNEGRYRFEINSNQPYNVLLKQISVRLGIPENRLEIFTEVGKQLNLNPAKKIKEIVYLKNGTILRVNTPAQNTKTFHTTGETLKASKSQEHFHNNPEDLLKRNKSINEINKRSNSKCNHGPNMMCINCLPTEAQSNKDKLAKEIQKKKEKEKEKEKEARPSNALVQSRSEKLIKPPIKSNQPRSNRIFINIPKKSLNSSGKSILSPRQSKVEMLSSTYKSPDNTAKKSKPKQSLSKCNHGSNSKCINCIDLKDKGKVQQVVSKCDHGQHSKCINCIGKKQKIAHPSFDQFLSKRKVNCAKNHAKGAYCSNCLPIKNVRLTMKPSCSEHQPFPKGMCMKCLPENCAIKRQEYRHVDYVQFMNSGEVSNFVKYWMQEKKMKEIRVGILYGYYAEDPFYPKGIRAIVEAIYEPAQKCTSSEFQLLDNEVKRQKIATVIDSLNLEKIGIIIASPNEKDYFTEEQVRLIASIQEQLSVQHSTGYKLSNFFTVLIQRNKDNLPIQPSAFMINDLGQAIQAAKLFIPNPNNPHKMLVKQKTLQNQMIPSFYLQGKQVKQFQIQFLLVNIASGISKSNKFAILKSHDFPALNRTQIKRKQVRDYLTKTRNKNKATRYSDLNLLIFLSDKISIQKVLEVGLFISEGIDIDNNLIHSIDVRLESLA